MENNIRLVVCLMDEEWFNDDFADYQVGPKKGELCTVEGNCEEYLYLKEYPQHDPAGIRDCYHYSQFIEVINSKEEIATVQVAGIQVPQLTEQ